MNLEKIYPNICMIPFVSLMINTDATFCYCCMAKIEESHIKNFDKDIYTIQKDSIRDVWNSEYIKDIRMSMLSGEPLKGCSICYSQEKNGRTSNRQFANMEWLNLLGEKYLIKLLKCSKKSSGYVKEDLTYLDLRLGNLCNLKCRMCNPWNSIQLAKEHIQLEKKDQKYKEVWQKSWGAFSEDCLEDQKAFDNYVLWDQIIELVPNLKKVYMTGGEPTLIKNNFNFLQSCIEKNRLDIILFFNTNCTYISDKFIDLIKNFKEVRINVSIDGIGYINDYIRYPSKWNQVSSNIEKLAQMQNVNLGITPTVQIYNVFNLIEILDYVDLLNKKFNKNIFIDFLINNHPNYLNVNILSATTRLEAKEMLLGYKDEHINDKTPKLTINSINGVIGFLENERLKNWEEELKNFKIITNALDIERGQSFNYLNKNLLKVFNEI